MSYLPRPAFLKNQEKCQYERDDTNKLSGFMSIETRKEDGSTYIAKIRRPMIFIDEPKAKRYFLIDCFFYFPKLIYRLYDKYLRKV